MPPIAFDPVKKESKENFHEDFNKQFENTRVIN